MTLFASINEPFLKPLIWSLQRSTFGSHSQTSGSFSCPSPISPVAEGPLLCPNHCLREVMDIAKSMHRSVVGIPTQSCLHPSHPPKRWHRCTIFSLEPPLPLKQTRSPCSGFSVFKTFAVCTNYFKPLFVVYNRAGLGFLEELLDGLVMSMIALCILTRQRSLFNTHSPETEFTHSSCVITDFTDTREK